ncbi:serine/threonine-protein kinase [Actinomadura flavalba]|uniref:serine/threonine-protein kinase n=1 Tax=Actinomadura flavalba TaxID=1120938 RepID=UPI000375A853|nr:serine/threonine-protein kinase [Actinomadura flavalba]
MTSPLRTTDPQELGPYRLTGRLGRGGMGTVYRGEDATGRPVAVKVINAELADEEAFRARFRREVTAARQVRRFCTAAVLDARLDGEPLYIVTEFVDGPSLEQAVRQNGPMHGGTLEGLAVGIATALAAIHGAGIVHRDLKPANVLLSPTGPRVIDFGIARALDAVDGPTRTGQFVGTPAYIAPEITRGGEVSPAADVFSWGCVVVYAATGRAPFGGATVPEIIHRVMTDAPTLDGLDPALHDLVAATLDKDPARRPAAREILARLTGDPGPSPTETAPATPGTTPDSTPNGAATPDATPNGAASARTHAMHGHAAPTVAGRDGDDGRAAQTRADAVPGGSGGAVRRLVRRPAVLAGIAGALVIAVLAWWVLRDPPPSPGSAITQRDNFSNVGSGWPNGQFDCGKYEKGRYVVGVASFDDSRSCSAPNQRVSPSGKYLIDVVVRLTGGPGNGEWDAGAYLSAVDDDNYYEVVFRPDGSVRLRKVVAKRSTDVAEARVKDFTSTGPNRLQVLLDYHGKDDRTTVSVWANGAKAFSYDDEDKPYRKGGTGIIVNRPNSSSQDTEAWAAFDDYALNEVE